MLRGILVKNKLWNFTEEPRRNPPHRPQERLRIIDNILLKEAYGNTLEVGCGIGRFLEKLNSSQRVSSVWAVDIEMQSTKAAYDKGFKAMLANGEKLPFKNGTFDTVMSADGAPKEMDWRLLFSEVHKVLKPAGIFAFDTYNKYPLKKIARHKIMRFLKTTDKPFKRIEGGIESIKDFREFCLRLNFKIISLYTVLSTNFFPREILLKGQMFSSIDTHFVGVLKKI